MLKHRRLFGKSWIKKTIFMGFLIILFFLPSVESILCVQCDTEAGEADCELEPPPPVNCTQCTLHDENNTCLQHSYGFKYESCVIVRKYDENDTMLAVTRTCSPIITADSCSYGTDNDRGGSQVKLCNVYCMQDGCNIASVPQPRFHMVAITTIISTSILYLFLPMENISR